MSQKKQNQKRSRAINEIVKQIGSEAWEKLTTSKKNALILEKINYFKMKAKEEKEYVKNLNKKYKGAIQWIIKRYFIIKKYLFFWLLLISTYNNYVLINS